ncbi:hypothetical protein [Roseiflexus sp.]|uniref:hypothetical protein n=1 Tax=Roseiflexus sp. TaxID=2562120 RepID=UPI0021DC78A0|nr:hypothetical protein [Roseiflexus sp.]GIW01688.1 MAG: hypothetical protein KatS3mg058_3091 [Roseiflexus sp.]
MTQRRGGIKRSSQLTFRRRLFIARMLLRGPASTEDLITAVQQELGAEGYPTAAVAALKHDLDALKSSYGCRITYRRDSGGYVLEDLGTLALLKGSETVRETMRLLEERFPADSTDPGAVHVHALLHHLRLLAAVEH